MVRSTSVWRVGRFRLGHLARRFGEVVHVRNPRVVPDLRIVLANGQHHLAALMAIVAMGGAFVDPASQFETFGDRVVVFDAGFFPDVN